MHTWIKHEPPMVSTTNVFVSQICLQSVHWNYLSFLTNYKLDSLKPFLGLHTCATYVLQKQRKAEKTLVCSYGSSLKLYNIYTIYNMNFKSLSKHNRTY